MFDQKQSEIAQKRLRWWTHFGRSKSVGVSYHQNVFLQKNDIQCKKWTY